MSLSSDKATNKETDRLIKRLREIDRQTDNERQTDRQIEHIKQKQNSNMHREPVTDVGSDLQQREP